MRIFAIHIIAVLTLSAVCFSAEYKPVDNIPTFTSPSRKRPAPAPARSAAKTRAPQASSTRQYVGKDGSPLLFGTVEIGMALKSLPQWIDVIARNLKDPIFQPERYFNKSTTWRQLRDKALGKAPLQQLQITNEFWNKWKYIDDRSNWNTSDYWENPAQFLKRSGDCEDYAIVKYYTLKELGFDPRAMRIVVLRNTFTGESHAVLAVYLNGDVYILDNLSPVVLSHKRIGQYDPQFSVNEFQRWQHIQPMGK